MKQIGFYFDQTRCIGCHTCSVACKDWHNIEAGSINWRRVILIEKGKFLSLVKLETGTSTEDKHGNWFKFSIGRFIFNNFFSSDNQSNFKSSNCS